MIISRERWFTLSLAEQLGHVGSEVGRARAWYGRDEKSFWGAVSRGMELLDLTREDTRWKKRVRELNRARDSFADAVLGGSEYQTTFDTLENYFMQFALYARKLD